MSRVEEDLCLEPAVFQGMPNLRLLNFYKSEYPCTLMYLPYFKKNGKVKLDEGLGYLPNSLRYLHWCDYPSKTLPSKFRPEFLVEIIMPKSQLTQLWDGVQPLGNLRLIDFSDSTQLVKIPDLSRATRLEHINLSYC
ncbi:hypothetical protein TIFTF001_024244 [Ficus carica]|uniref:Disease resistance protein n=1 Tax=Ficus carica TaxID=3494 RepID=A0AA88DFX3_FICCA|nr:hypothetical protein TIFTF001_024244 [Ficus carica]